MLFRSKKKADAQLENPQVNAQDKSVHRTFQIGAILVIGYVLFTMYSGKTTEQDASFDPGDAHYMSDDQIKAKVQEQVALMLESPEFKAIKDFADLTQNNLDQDEPKILEAQEGVLVFIPNAALAVDHKEIKIENDKIKLNISSEKKQVAEKAPADPKAGPDAKTTNLEPTP